MGKNLLSWKRKSLTETMRNNNRTRFSVDCNKSAAGLFFGVVIAALVIVASIVTQVCTFVFIEFFIKYFVCNIINC